MRFKSVLVVVTNANQAKAAINAGAQMALGNDGHLDVLALGVDQTQLGYSYIGGGAVLTQLSLDRAQNDAKLAASVAKAVLDAQDPTLRWNLDTAVAEMGGVSAMVGNAASFVDLVVQTRPYGDGQSYEAEAVVEAALFDAHAPVLIIPAGCDAKGLAAPKRILLAWNQSAEALIAAKRALPLLQAADFVDVTVVDPPARGPERSDPGGLLCQFLVRHGVKAEVTVLARIRHKVSEVLAQHATDRNADMMVMGAYGHSRLREAVLGGATRAVLEGTRIPVFMAH